jgi:hypothetical protein
MATVLRIGLKCVMIAPYSDFADSFISAGICNFFIDFEICFDFSWYKGGIKKEYSQAKNARLYEIQIAMYETLFFPKFRTIL